MPRGTDTRCPREESSKISWLIEESCQKVSQRVWSHHPAAIRRLFLLGWRQCHYSTVFRSCTTYSNVHKYIPSNIHPCFCAKIAGATLLNFDPWKPEIQRIITKSQGLSLIQIYCEQNLINENNPSIALTDLFSIKNHWSCNGTTVPWTLFSPMYLCRPFH